MLKLSKTAIRELNKMYRAVLIASFAILAFTATTAMATQIIDEDLQVNGNLTAGATSITSEEDVTTTALTVTASNTGTGGTQSNITVASDDLSIKGGKTITLVSGDGDDAANGIVIQDSDASSSVRLRNTESDALVIEKNDSLSHDYLLNVQGNVKTGAATIAETVTDGTATALSVTATNSSTSNSSSLKVESNGVTISGSSLTGSGTVEIKSGTLTSSGRVTAEGGISTAYDDSGTTKYASADFGDTTVSTLESDGDVGVGGGLSVSGNVILGNNSQTATPGNPQDNVTVNAQLKVGVWEDSDHNERYRLSVTGTAEDGDTLVKVDTAKGLDVARGDLRVGKKTDGSYNFDVDKDGDITTNGTLKTTGIDTTTADTVKLGGTGYTTAITGNTDVNGVMTVRSTEGTDAFLVVGPDTSSGATPGATQQVAHIDNTGKLWVRDSVGANGSLSIGLKTPPTDPTDPSTAKYFFQVNGANGNVMTDGNLTVGSTGKQVFVNGSTGALETDGLITANNGLTIASGKNLTLGGTNVSTIDTGSSSVTTGSATTVATTATVLKSAENATYTAKTSTADLAKRNITSNTTVNGAVDTLDTTIGKASELATATGSSYHTGGAKAMGNLTNGGTSTPNSVVQALENIDQSMGKIHKLVKSDGSVDSTKTGASTVGKHSNLAKGTTVEDHLISLDNAIGDRTLTSANGAINTGMTTSLSAGLQAAGDQMGSLNYTSTSYVHTGDDLTTAISRLDDGLSKVGANWDQLDSRITQTEKKVEKMDKQMKSGFASMAAVAGLKPNARACSDTQIALGGGYYRGTAGVALGAFHYVNDNLMLNIGGGYAGNQSATVSGGLTFGW